MCRASCLSPSGGRRTGFFWRKKCLAQIVSWSTRRRAVHGGSIGGPTVYTVSQYFVLSDIPYPFDGRDWRAAVQAVLQPSVFVDRSQRRDETSDW